MPADAGRNIAPAAAIAGRSALVRAFSPIYKSLSLPQGGNAMSVAEVANTIAKTPSEAIDIAEAARLAARGASGS